MHCGCPYILACDLHSQKSAKDGGVVITIGLGPLPATLTVGLPAGHREHTWSEEHISETRAGKEEKMVSRSGTARGDEGGGHLGADQEPREGAPLGTEPRHSSAT